MGSRGLCGTVTGEGHFSRLALAMCVTAWAVSGGSAMAAAENARAEGARSGQQPGPESAPPEHDSPLPDGDGPRDRPDYGGRGREGGSGGDTLLWVPRVASFPLYVFSEYAIRRPVGALIRAVERYHLPAKYHELLTFGERDQIGIFPTGRIDLGLRPTFGFYSYFQDPEGEFAVKLRATTGGLQLWTVNALVQVPLGPGERVRFTADYSRRPDKAFFGLGAEGRDDLARYREQRIRGRVEYDFDRAPFAFATYMGVLSASFDPAHGDLGDHSLSEAIGEGIFSPPPALEGGVLVLQTGLLGRIDTRPSRIQPPPKSARDLERGSGSGLGLGAHVEHDAGLEGTRATRGDHPRIPHWLRYGAVVAGALDVTGTRRILELETVVELAESLPSDNPIPFSEQVSLGGDYPLRAFRSGRLVDRSAAVGTLRYRWPIWDYIDGHLHYAVGNVFASHLGNFAFDSLRSSFGMGLDSAASLDQPFEMLLAFGTKPFRDGGAIDSVRFVVGTRAHF